MPDTAVRRALITGASSGIGRATARLLAREGYVLALLARRETKLRELAGEIVASGGKQPLLLVSDLRDPRAIEAAFTRIERELGGLDLLVNNAGMGYRAKVEELDDELLRELFETNVIAPLLCARSALPLLRRGRASVLINVASVVGRRGIPGQSAYSASKAALVSIGEALRIEWAREQIAVCTLEPGLTATGFFEAQPNPAGLAPPDLSRSDAAEDVARAILELDRNPRAQLSLRPKWRVLALLSQIAPRLGDRLLLRRLGGGWSLPER